jgi:hypothetical protein
MSAVAIGAIAIEATAATARATVIATGGRATAPTTLRPRL